MRYRKQVVALLYSIGGKYQLATCPKGQVLVSLRVANCVYKIGFFVCKPFVDDLYSYTLVRSLSVYRGWLNE